MAGKPRTTEEISQVLVQAEAGVPVKGKYGVAEAAFYAWRKKYGGLAPSELKRLFADLAMDKQIPPDAVSGQS